MVCCETSAFSQKLVYSVLFTAAMLFKSKNPAVRCTAGEKEIKAPSARDMTAMFLISRAKIKGGSL